jgi:hypothetical protein
MEASDSNADKVIASLNKVEEIAGIPSFRENLCNLLIDTQSVIAGGFVLGSIRNTLSRQSDLDIYVPHSAASKVVDFFLAIGKYPHCHTTHPYDHSFFYKNGILARFTFYIYEPMTIECFDDKTISVDVMVLREDRGVIECVSNFDFTFCEVWFDGRSVNGTHLEDAIAGRGTMRQDYLAVFLAGNKFTLSRYKKYISRGYSITLHYPEIDFDLLRESREKRADPSLLIINETINGLSPLRPLLPYSEKMRRSARLITSSIDTFLTHTHYEKGLLDQLRLTLNYLKSKCAKASEFGLTNVNYQEIVKECERVQELIAHLP